MKVWKILITFTLKIVWIVLQLYTEKWNMQPGWNKYCKKRRQNFTEWLKKHKYYVIYVICCSIWFPLHNFKNVKNTHGEVLLLVKLQAKTNTAPRVFSTFFKIVQIVTNHAKHLILFSPIREMPSLKTMERHDIKLLAYQETLILAKIKWPLIICAIDFSRYSAMGY